jgi:predicted anti-sigma-YlaC factor YlaD
MNCYETIDRMGDALDGTLAVEAGAGFEAHLEECAACRTYFDQLRVVRAALRRLRGDGKPNAARNDLMASFRREFRARG